MYLCKFNNYYVQSSTYNYSKCYLPLVEAQKKRKMFSHTLLGAWWNQGVTGWCRLYKLLLLNIASQLTVSHPPNQGRRNDVKARGADFRERALLNWYILRDVCKTSGVELRLIMFSIYWMIGVWGGSPPGDCAILEAQWLHFLRFLKQICKRIALTFLTFAISPRQSFKLKGHLCPPWLRATGAAAPQFRRPCTQPFYFY
jgi:hypothetical protein